jgi:hypothetical protein
MAFVPISRGGCHLHQISLLKTIMSIFKLNERIAIIVVSSVAIFITPYASSKFQVDRSTSCLNSSQHSFASLAASAFVATGISDCAMSRAHRA